VTHAHNYQNTTDLKYLLARVGPCVCLMYASLCQTTSLACLVYVSTSKYLLALSGQELALAGQVLAFTGPREGDAVGLGVDSNKKVNAFMERSKGFLLYILDNPFVSSRSISVDSDLSSKKAFASRWSCSKVN
jgi:hypothetical protein